MRQAPHGPGRVYGIEVCRATRCWGITAAFALLLGGSVRAGAAQLEGSVRGGAAQPPAAAPPPEAPAPLPPEAPRGDTPRRPPPAPSSARLEDAAQTSHDPKPKAPNRPYRSRGVYSRYSFGLGVHVGVKSFSSGTPVLAGISAHFRASGIAGLTIEYDFNRAQEEPTPEQLLLSARYLHFIPNLRVHAVIFPYRWRMLGPFILLGMGFDTEAHERSTNLQVGLGLEATFWKHRLGVAVAARAFFPLPSDVERHRERVDISGRTVDTSTWEYYNLKNLLFTVSLRYFY